MSFNPNKPIKCVVMSIVQMRKVECRVTQWAQVRAREWQTDQLPSPTGVTLKLSLLPGLVKPRVPNAGPSQHRVFVCFADFYRKPVCVEATPAFVQCFPGKPGEKNVFRFKRSPGTGSVEKERALCHGCRPRT